MSARNGKMKGKASSQSGLLNNNNQKKANKSMQMQKGDRQVNATKRLKVGEWEKMVANPEAVRPVRTPSQSPFTGAVRNFVRTFELSRADLGKDDFDLVVNPDIRNTLLLPDPNAVIVPAGYAFDGGSSFSIAGIASPQGGQLLTGSLNLIVQGDPTVITNLPTVWEDGFGPYFDLAGTAATGMDVSVSDGMMSLEIWAKIAGVWTFQKKITPGTTGWVPTGVFDRMAFAARCPNVTHGISINLVQVFGAPVPTITTTQKYSTFSTDALNLGRVSRYRVTAMSVLVTYAGNMFNNGGVIAAARTRAGYYYDGAPYESLTKLQDHVYRGALADGAYVWWLPYNLEEMDFRGPFDSKVETELRVAGVFADSSASLQITVNMNVEFYSPLQIFEHEVGPALTDEFVRAYHKMDTVPAACCNPDHTEVLKKVLSGGKAVARNAIGAVLAHPELAAALLAGLL